MRRHSSIVRDQIDHTLFGHFDQDGPICAESASLANYSHKNDVSYNLIFDISMTLNDGGGITTG